MMIKTNIIVASLIVIFFGILWFIPIYSLLAGSLKSLQEVMGTPVITPPSNINLDTALAVANELKEPILNTIIIVVPTAFMATFLGTLAAYAIYRKTSKISDTLMLLVAIATYIPYQSILVPLVDIIKKLGLYNTLPGVALGFLIYFTPMAALMMVIFSIAVPKDLIEAALVDGASELQIFRKVVLPVLGPGIVSTIIFMVIMIWNNFFIPLILTRGYEKYITLKIFSYVGQSGTFYNNMFAAALIGSLPPLIIFILLGRYFIRGLVVLGTGTKG
ncbi:MAG: ABC transporter permease subunit [Thermoprotei archaeon]